MPIRFRCAYCNQLLGIARRKAGTVVRCPTCAGEVVVPRVEEGERAGERPARGFFEENEFEKLFGDEPQPQPAEPGPPPEDRGHPPTGAWGTHADPEIEVERVDLPRGGIPGGPPVSAPGILLSPVMATVLTVLVVLALLIAFGLGLLIGRWTSVPARPPAPPAAPVPAEGVWIPAFPRP